MVYSNSLSNIKEIMHYFEIIFRIMPARRRDEMKSGHKCVKRMSSKSRFPINRNDIYTKDILIVQNNL